MIPVQHNVNAAGRPQRSRGRRRGAVLILVLVIVMLLSFSLYSFSERMLQQYRATSTSLTHMQLRSYAQSAVAAVGDLLVNGSPTSGSLRRNGIAHLARIPLSNSGRGFEGFSVLKHLPGPGEQPQFGITDEAARLNLNSLLLAPEHRRQSRERLTQLLYDC